MSTPLLSCVLACLACTGATAGPLSLDCFSTKPSHAAFVTQENALLSAAPETDSGMAATTSVGDQVCVLSRKTVRDATWVFVQSYSFDGQTDQPLRGWIQEDALAYWNELRPMRDVDAQDVSVEIGDYLGDYNVSKGGKFSLPVDEGEYSCREHIGRCKAWVVRGQLLHKGDFVVAATGGTKFIDLFKRIPSGRLCPLRSEAPPPECSQRSHR